MPTKNETNKKIKSILKQSPKINKTIWNKMNRKYKPYLFFETEKDHSKTFTCSSCCKTFNVNLPKREMTEGDYALYNAGHNDVVECPHCHRTATAKNIKISRGCKSLFEWKNFVFLIPGKDPEKEVWLMAYETSKRYGEEKGTGALKIDVDSIYRITQSGAEQIKSCYYYPLYERGLQKRWDYKKDLEILEPFWTTMGGKASYITVDFSNYKNTFLRYSAYDIFEKRMEYWNSACRYLSLYPTHRAYEMFMKTNLEAFVIASVLARRENKQLIDWNTSDPKKVFKMGNEVLREIRPMIKLPVDGSTYAYNSAMREISKLRFYKKYQEMMSVAQAYQFYDDFEYQQIDRKEIIDIVEKANIGFNDFYKWLNKQVEKSEGLSRRRIISDFVDSVAMGKRIDLDLTQSIVLLPKDIEVAHSERINILNAIKEEKKAKKQQELEEKNNGLQESRNKQYAYENDEFFIKVPESLSEIVAEGQKQEHCVASYVDRHAQGTLTILFLRKKDKPQVPLYTIEMHDKKMVQVQGYRNKTPLTEEAKAFFDEWVDWVKKGSKRKKRSSAA